MSQTIITSQYNVTIIFKQPITVKTDSFHTHSSGRQASFPSNFIWEWEEYQHLILNNLYYSQFCNDCIETIMWFNEITKKWWGGGACDKGRIKGPHLLGFSSSRIRSHYSKTHNSLLINKDIYPCHLHAYVKTV